MPTYVWECPECRATREVISTVADRNAPQVCSSANATHSVAMVRVITAPQAMPDLKPYRAVAGDKAGQEISGRRAHREFLRRNRLIEVGDAPIRDTKAMRPIHKRGEIARELKRVVPEALKRGRR